MLYGRSQCTLVRMLLLFSLLLGMAGCGESKREAALEKPKGPELFSDITAGSGIAFTHFNGMSGEYYLPEITGAGVALLDYNNDGNLDILVLQGAPLGTASFPNAPKEPCTARLYRSDPAAAANASRTLKWTDVTDASGLCSHGYGMGIAVGDIDNDGCVDVFVTHYAADNQLFRNNCNGTFTDVTSRAGVAGQGRWGMSASFVDIDRDGLLDLFVTHYVDFDLAKNAKCSSSTGARDWCTPAVYKNVPGILYRNRGDGTFEDISEKSGITRAYGAGMGVIAADFNDDGWPDILVANDMNPNQLWINQKNGTFRDEAAIRGCAVNADGAPESNMGADLGDYNNDGMDDVIITHIAREKATLFVNLGGGQFEDRSAIAGLYAPTTRFTGFGVAFADYDNDGWLDLLIINGAVTRLVAAGDDPLPLKQPRQLLRNLGNGRFEDVTAQAGPAFAPAEVGRGLAMGDLDNDGAIDFVVSNNNGPLRIVRNTGAAAKPWLGLRLLSGKRDAYGARVEVKRRDEKALWRRVRADASYLSANDPRISIGLGNAAVVEKLTVYWPDGSREHFSATALNQYTTLVQGTGVRDAAQ
jgi:hypothetical protein